MGKINGLNQDPTGQVGNVVYRQTKKGTVVAKQPRKASTPRRSEKQMYTRCQLGNVAANYRLYEERLALAFEDKTPAQSEFNLYIQANYGGQNAVFITKQERLNGACVVAPYTFCRGTLGTIGYDVNGGGILVSNLALGGLTISASTTVGQFSAAVINNNAGWKELDMLSFFSAIQSTDPQTLVPRAEMESWKVVIDSSDNTLLYSVVTALGFTSLSSPGAGNVLGMSIALENAGAAWVHTRDRGDGTGLRVGTQRLYVVNEMLSDYQTTAAWKASADSYGGVNTKAAYLSPSATMAARNQATDDEELDNEVTGGGNANQNANQNQNGGSSSGTGTNTGGSSTGSDTGNGGNTGGNTGGSETSGTPVLTISKTGSGSATVSAGGNSLNSGAEVAAETEVSLSVTPATGQTPTATLNGNSVELTEDSGTYTGTFTMPNANATLVINTGSAEGYGDTN